MLNTISGRAGISSELCNGMTEGELATASKRCHCGGKSMNDASNTFSRSELVTAMTHTFPGFFILETWVPRKF